MTTADQERLAQLAWDTAWANHERCSDVAGVGARDGHVGIQRLCPHADCVLVRPWNRPVPGEVVPVAALRALLDWQPIDTAPLDGSWMLAKGCNGSPLVLVVGYRKETMLWRHPGRWVSYGDVTVLSPTHWMPLQVLDAALCDAQERAK